jgi:hypothetical protein
MIPGGEMMKKGILIFFSLILFLKAQEIQNRLLTTLTLREPRLSLFSLDPGFLSLSQSSGIAGADLNPASLGFLKGGEVVIGMGIGAKTKGSFHYDFPYTSETGDTTFFPFDTDFTIEDKGGIDFFGAAFKWGIFSGGFGVERSSGFGLTSFGDISAEYETDSLFQFYYTFTHDDIPNIPEGDSVPVRFDISGKMKSTFYVQNKAEFSIKPIFFGGALNFGPLSFGVGLKIKKYSARLKTRIRTSLDSLSLDIIPHPEGEYNTDSFHVLTDFPQDTELISVRYDGSGSGVQTSFLLGYAYKFGGSFGLSLGFEFGNKMKLKGNLERRLLKPDTISGDLTIDSTYLDSVYVDPINKVVSGKLRVNVPEIVKEIEEDSWSEGIVLSRFLAVRAGLKIFFINLSGGAEFSIGDGKLKLMTGYVAPNLSFPFSYANFRIGGALIVRTFQYEGEFLPTVPVAYLSMGLSIKPPLNGPVTVKEFQMGLNVNPTPLLLRMGEKELGDGRLSISGVKYTVTFGIGVKIGVGL